MPELSSVSGFAPLVTVGARILVLGSLPSKLSLQTGQYYGNPQNAFWRLMGDIFDAGTELPYSERANRLSKSGVAVWDVLQSSVRPGSMDSAIDQSTAVANDFTSFFAQSPNIQLVCFNGQKAAQMFERLVVPDIGDQFESLRYQTLPSTSPAYAAMSFDEKLRHWSVLKTEIYAYR